MGDSRSKHAVKQGANITVGALWMAYGVATIRQPSEPPLWTVLFVSSLVLGSIYTGLVYFEVGPIRVDS
ncbi:hypothetical protein [Natrinema halophilum]|uniref:Uncharacterized protein n=1 Tax=Natrinema halophilum TaxID=1699371 RepID=A0A7D5GIM6_9EURY|nr:hypothetical protein [Natrinema halophilum]QLG50014.1 hypothetical protein HYG82_14690 [Natrinema halophilum]